MTGSPPQGLSKLLWLIAVATPLGLTASPAVADSCRALIVQCQHKCVAQYERVLKEHWSVQAQNERTACLNGCETRNYGQCEGPALIVMSRRRQSGDPHFGSSFQE